MKLALAALILFASAIPAEAKPVDIHLVQDGQKSRNVIAQNIVKNIYLEPVSFLDV